MRVFFHQMQKLHHPQIYFSRGRMRIPQEVPERTERLLQAAAAMGMEIKAPEDFGMAPLACVHDADYLSFLQEAHQRWKEMPDDWGDEVVSNIFVRHPNPLRGVLAQAGKYLADGSCPIGENTWSSAYWSAQSAVAGARALIDGERAAYSICRPPGHHARRDAAGGFCYLNNAAIAAQELLQRFGRVAILDTDMHHGQGTQEIFYDRSDVLCVSIHGDPTNFYPVVAGFEDERGSGPGEGFNLNLPMPHGAQETCFFERLDIALPAIKVFEPGAIVLSLGFDIYELDPQSTVDVTRSGIAKLGRLVRALELPCLVVQEGGYHLESLTDNACAFFSAA